MQGKICGRGWDVRYGNEIYPAGKYVGEGQTHNNTQPSVATNYIIKAHQSAGVVAEVIQEDGEASDTNVYSAEAVKELLKDKKDKQQSITTGQEFETGRIIDGKKEYGKILDLGIVPSNTQQTYTTGISLATLDRYTFISGYTSSTWAITMVPQKIDNNSIVLTMAGKDLKITTYLTSYADANYKAYVELHYLKK